MLLFLTTGASSEFYSCHYQTRSCHVLHNPLHPRQCSQDWRAWPEKKGVVSGCVDTTWSILAKQVAQGQSSKIPSAPQARGLEQTLQLYQLGPCSEPGQPGGRWNTHGFSGSTMAWEQWGENRGALIAPGTMYHPPELQPGDAGSHRQSEWERPVVILH